MTENNAAQPGLTDTEKDAIYHAWQNHRDEASYGDLIDAVESALLSKLRAERVQTGDERANDALTLLRKYKALCMEIGRGDSYHLGRIDAAIAALASAPVAGEANTALNEWLDKTDFIQKRIASGDLPVKYLGWHRADVMRDLIENAAPQASEAVRNEALYLLREARALLPAFATAEAIGAWSEKVNRFAAGDVIDIPPQADKDVGDCAKGAGDEAVRDAAFEAVRKKLCKLPRYSFFVRPKPFGGVQRFEDRSGNWIDFDAAHALFDPVSVDAALSPTQPTEQGGRDE